MTQAPTPGPLDSQSGRESAEYAAWRVWDEAALKSTAAKEGGA